MSHLCTAEQRINGIHLTIGSNIGYINGFEKANPILQKNERLVKNRSEEGNFWGRI